MCLIINKLPNRESARKRKPRIAQKDIVVYKRLVRNDDGSFGAPYYPMEYKPRRTYRVKQFSKAWYKLTSEYTLHINKGLHAKTNPKEFFLYGGNYDVVVQMIIPKGTPYYLSNYNSDIVALKLRTPKQF